MIVFEGDPGRVAVLPIPALAGKIKPLVTVDPELGFRGQRSIITRLTVAQQTSHQFLHTLGGDIYIYVFGDRIGQVTISGLSFGGACEAASFDDSHGLERMLRWYNKNKLSTRREPVAVQIGNLPVIRGFVANMTTDVVDPQTWLSQYNLTLMMIPPKEYPDVPGDPLPAFNQDAGSDPLFFTGDIDIPSALPA